ncbi:S-type pyocin domain-containing protein [Pseudomonas sichuanensis]|uniref:S-type pyocin domain-containing protein n=1 Tax=Pseudomonas sichuanensis TaxID=2213015 RepID=UPI00244A6A01|nr:S-type pyocin domain-containing protein [Pseudomonas sichuanensis]MDH0731532.1 S-type pyocin domain-containing protein [Pseudomonas sichuanensis]MDH1583767.1 S-type pyocin domain-containing protein [Pseudomonas sichuanensis]MDH1595774.1 S-type pyocin domain-containing protein [Pseudomonas sichuanensis]MDH1598904.1 S-type pyocin domain-containing protein [Pseudomonas sichuanensis]
MFKDILMARKKRQVVLPPTYVGAQPPIPGGRSPGGSTINHIAPILEGLKLSAYQAMSIADGAAREAFLAKLSALAGLLEKEVAVVRQTLAGTQQSHIDMLKGDIEARTLLVQRKRTDLSKQQALANSYYGSTPFGKDYEYYAIATFHNISTGRFNRSNMQEALNASYRGAYTVQLREAEIQMLQAQIETLQQALANAEALFKAQEEADAEARASEAEAKEQALAAARAANTYTFTLATTVAPHLVVPGIGGIGLSGAVGTLANAIASLKAARIGGIAGPFAAGFAALLYPSELGNGELPDNFVFSTPLTDLMPGFDVLAQEAALASGAVEMPLRMGSSSESEDRAELYVAATDDQAVSSTVRVLAAHFDAQTGQYTVATEDSPPRTLLWTPAVTPGSSSTTTPAVSPSAPALVGPTLEPIEGRLDEYPDLPDAEFDDYVIIFPADSGLPPLYVMFKSPRYMPGVVAGEGREIEGTLLVEGNEQGVAIPVQIASEMRGQQFGSFDRFRGEFWKRIASSPDFASQFDRVDIIAMKQGLAPLALPDEPVGGKVKYEIHHVERIVDGGEVYDLDNMVIISPKFHMQMHRR